MEKPPISRKDNIVVQKFSDETLIYDLNVNKAFCLNETLRQIWELCDGKADIDEITLNLSRGLNKPVDQNLVWLAIDQLKKANLISYDNRMKNPIEGLNRRAIIKKVGFTSLIALPMLSSIVAPEAIMAQSVCTQNTNTCSLDSECCSGICANTVRGPECCATRIGNSSPGTADIDTVTCPIGPPCSIVGICQSTAASSCCSGLTAPTTVNCRPLNSTIQECECACG